MKQLFILLLAGLLWLPVTSHSQDAEALGALVGVLQDVDDPAFQLDILKGIAEALKGQRNMKPPKGWAEVAPLNISLISVTLLTSQLLMS